MSVIESLYDAALDESRWPETLKALMQVLDSQAASFWVWKAGRAQAFVSLNFDPAAVKDYVGGMSALDPTVRYLIANPHQPIVHDALLGEMDDDLSREYTSWHHRCVETRSRMVAQCAVGPDTQSGVALHRSHSAGHYTAADIDRFSLLRRHLQRSLLIATKIGSLEARNQFHEDWIAERQVGIVLLDSRGRVNFLNHYAESIARAEDGIRIVHQGLELSREHDNRALQGLIARTLARDPSAPAATGGAMSAPRPSGKRAYSIVAAPCTRGPMAFAPFRPAASVVITDPHRSAPLPSQQLQDVFQLTAAEARLAGRLVAGDNLRTAAESLHITYGTARVRLAQIFQKTRTRRQSELLHLLLTTLAGI